MKDLVLVVGGKTRPVADVKAAVDLGKEAGVLGKCMGVPPFIGGLVYEAKRRDPETEQVLGIVTFE